MDSSRLLDSSRDPYARRQPPSMALPTSLSSGQPYYTVESLEGVSSLPFLKPGLASSAPLPSERDALLRLDTETRFLLADREALDARARLLVSEREALLRRNFPGSKPLADRRAYVDGLSPTDARTRKDILLSSYLADRKEYTDGLPPADARTRQDVLPTADARTRPNGLPHADARTRPDGLPALDAPARPYLDDLQAAYARVLVHELDRPPHDALRRGIDDRGRAPATVDGPELGAQECRNMLDLVRYRDVSEVARSRTASHDARRRRLDDRRGAPAAVDGPEFRAQERRNLLEMVLNRDVAAVGRSGTAPFYPPVDSFQSGRDVTDVRIPAIPLDSSFRRRDIADVRTPAMPLDSSFRRRDIADVRTSDSSRRWRSNASQPSASGFRGRSDRPLVKRSREPAAPRFAPAEAARKRASEAKPEASHEAKRSKTISASAFGNGAPTQDATDAMRGKGDGKADHYKEKSKKLAAENRKESTFLVCEVCKITATGKKNLESHLKGKRHLARLKELASS